MVLLSGLLTIHNYSMLSANGLKKQLFKPFTQTLLVERVTKTGGPVRCGLISYCSPLHSKTDCLAIAYVCPQLRSLR